MKEFLTFQRFNDKALAEDFISLLNEKGILYETEDNSSDFDATFANNDFTKEIRVKIMQEDFMEVNDLLLQKASADITTADNDYYLFDFSDEELVEIISKPDEWSHYDYSLSIKILKERGKEINPELASILRKNRVQELSKPEIGTQLWIVLGYGLALIGGILGIFIGLHISTYKRILPTGDKVYAFKESDRKNGLVITVIGIVVLLISLVLRIFNAIEF